MKTILTFSGIFLSSWSLLTAESLTQDAPANWREDLSFNAEAGFNSRYMWDGVAASENPVFNPAASATFRNFTAGFWSNMNFNEPGSEGKFNEVDLNLAYEWSWNNLTVTPEYIHYFYPNTAGAKNTGELALSAAYTFWDDLMDVHTNNRFDIKENKRGYVGTFGLGASTDYTEKLNVAVSADAVVTSPKANEVWGFRKEWALQTFRINLESTYQLTPALYVKPNVMFSTIVDSGIRSDAKTASIDRDVFSGGLALGADF